MAKKKSSSRRVPKIQAPSMYGNGKPAVRASSAPSTTSAPSTGTYSGTSRTQVVRTEAQLASEYHYVLSDLRRLGTLAAATFVVLIALGLIIR